MDKQPQVAVVIRPFHELGLTLCRLLAMEGTRIIVLDRDPSVGEAFCHRLGMEGFSASYRFVDPDLRHGEGQLRKDLADVYGQIRTLITFFEPVAASNRLNFLDMSAEVALKLVQQAFDWRLRLLKALTPLFGDEQGGLVLNVVMGQGGEVDGGQRPDALIAGLLNELLAPDWAERGVQVRQVSTAVGGYTPGARDDEVERLQADVGRVLDLLGGQPTRAH